MRLERALPIYTLPSLPRRATVLGGLDGWRTALEGSGIEVVDDGADLVVAPADRAAEAVGADLVVLEGRGGAGELKRAGYTVRTLLAVPGPDSPEVLLPLGDPEPVRYALGRLVGSGRPLRNRVVAPLLARGVVPPGRVPTVVAARDPGPPALVSAATGLSGCQPLSRDLRWLPVLARWGDAFSRGVLLLFEPGAAEPRWALKFARVRGNERPFELDERGLGLAAAAGGTVAAHAPRLLGRFDVEGRAASLETATSGNRLLAVLAGPAPREARLEQLALVSGWIETVAGETRGTPADLAPERERLAREVVPRWDVPADLAGVLDSVPSVFEHADLWPDNVIVDGAGGFGLLDWEAARAHGMPLWDLFYLLTSSLAVVDGVSSEDDRDEHFLRLWRGELPSSAVLFDWTRRVVAASAVPPEAVGPIATLRLLSLALDDLRHAERPGAAGGEQPVSARLARRWLDDPALGPGWDRWRT